MVFDSVDKLLTLLGNVRNWDQAMYCYLYNTIDVILCYYYYYQCYYWMTCLECKKFSTEAVLERFDTPMNHVLETSQTHNTFDF